MLTEIGIMSVLVLFLDVISHLLPVPGTNEGISIYLLPIFIMSFRYGMKGGIYTGLSSSVLFLVLGHFHSFTWAQYLLDYPVALTVVAVAGYYHKKLIICDCNCESRSSYLIKGIFIGTMLKFMVNSLSTYIFIDLYFEELTHRNISIFDSLVTNSGVIFSVLYNTIHYLPSIIITTFILLRIFKVYGNRILVR